MRNWATRKRGAVIVLEKDDPAGGISIRDYLKASPIPVKGLGIHVYAAEELARYSFGPDFLSWLDGDIRRRQAALVVMDSYTALRPHRPGGKDIVKVESDEMTLINQLGKKTGATIEILHHPSGGHLKLDWTDQLGGTYALGAAVEGILHIARFGELAGDAPERLLQGQLRHGENFAAVVRFRRATLDYELVLEGMAAPYFSDLRALADAFERNVFTPHDLCHQLGMARATATRLIARLVWTGAILRIRYGEYRLNVNGI
jgi:hypothetical protein